MKTNILIKSCIAGFIMTMISGCTGNLIGDLDVGNIKYKPWNVATSKPVADPNISIQKTPINGKGSYWSFLYLFGVYEVDNEYAGFDILYFLDFTHRYKAENVAYENSSFFLPLSRSERLKRMTLNKMCVKSDYDVVLSPMYRLEHSDFPILWQESKLKTKAYASKLNGFTINGKIVNDTYIPASASVAK